MASLMLCPVWKCPVSWHTRQQLLDHLLDRHSKQEIGAALADSETVIAAVELNGGHSLGETLNESRASAFAGKSSR